MHVERQERRALHYLGTCLKEAFMEDPGLLAVSADQQIAVRLSDGLKLRAVPFEGFTGCTAC